MLAHHLMRVKGKRRSVLQSYTETSDVSTITIPSTILPGDVGILIDRAYGGAISTPSAVIPSGWDEFIANWANVRVRWCMTWRVLTASDAGATVTGMPKPGSGNVGKYLQVFRIYHGKGNPAIVNTALQYTSGDPSPQTVPVSNYGYGSVMCAACQGSNPTFTSGSFDNAALNTVSTNRICIGYKLNNFDTSDNTVDSGDNSFDNNALTSWILKDE